MRARYFVVCWVMFMAAVAAGCAPAEEGIDEPRYIIDDDSSQQPDGGATAPDSSTGGGGSEQDADGPPPVPSNNGQEPPIPEPSNNGQEPPTPEPSNNGQEPPTPEPSNNDQEPPAPPEPVRFKTTEFIYLKGPRNGPTDIYVVDVVRQEEDRLYTNERLLYSHDGLIRSAIISFDRSAVIFTTRSRSTYYTGSVYLLPADGTRLSLLLEPVRGEGASNEIDVRTSHAVGHDDWRVWFTVYASGLGLNGMLWTQYTPLAWSREGFEWHSGRWPCSGFKPVAVNPWTGQIAVFETFCDGTDFIAVYDGPSFTGRQVLFRNRDDGFFTYMLGQLEWLDPFRLLSDSTKGMMVLDVRAPRAPEVFAEDNPSNFTISLDRRYLVEEFDSNIWITDLSADKLWWKLTTDGQSRNPKW